MMMFNIAKQGLKENMKLFKLEDIMIVLRKWL